MAFRPLLCTLVVAATGVAFASCTAYRSDMGPDPLSGSDARMVTWSDGQPAVAIECTESRGCSQRARAVCMPGSPKVLKRAVEAIPLSVVVRCN